jgi:hypothetical protein
MRYCMYETCAKLAIWGFVDEQPELCFLHRDWGMRKVIWNCACGKGATYGLQRFKATHCATCKEERMWRVLEAGCWTHNCNERAIYGIPNNKPTACLKHMKRGMINRVRPQCSLCTSVGVNKNYKPYCAGCFFFLNPTDPRKRFYKLREHAFLLPIKDIYPDIVIDKTIEGGCSKRRPDGLIHMNGYNIVIEIDEGQHLKYDTLCENRRTMEIFQDLGSLPLVFIRLNPDGYWVGKKRVKSVFDTKGKASAKMLQERIDVLVQTIEGVKQSAREKDVQVIELFYNKALG